MFNEYKTLMKNPFLKNHPLKKSLFFVFLGILITGIGCSETPAAADPADKNTVITSARINSLGKFSFKYGSIEASIKLPPTANGLWPAFWLLGADYKTSGWPGCGEIDILEMGGQNGIESGTQDKLFNQGCHWGEILGGGGHPSYTVEYDYPASLQDTFHQYRMVWDNQKISMYIDNAPAPYFVMNINVFSGSYPVGNYFNKPFFILFNLAVGGDYPGIYKQEEITALNKGNAYIAAMYVDYVRVYDSAGQLVWKDEFDGPALDETKWNIEVNDLGGGNHELQSYRRENVSIGREPVTGKNCLILKAALQ